MGAAIKAALARIDAPPRPKTPMSMIRNEGRIVENDPVMEWNNRVDDDEEEEPKPEARPPKKKGRPPKPKGRSPKAKAERKPTDDNEEEDPPKAKAEKRKRGE